MLLVCLGNYSLRRADAVIEVVAFDHASYYKELSAASSNLDDVSVRQPSYANEPDRGTEILYINN